MMRLFAQHFALVRGLNFKISSPGAPFGSTGHLPVLPSVIASSPAAIAIFLPALIVEMQFYLTRSDFTFS
jgi:hypothetical protein